MQIQSRCSNRGLREQAESLLALCETCRSVWPSESRHLYSTFKRHERSLLCPHAGHQAGHWSRCLALAGYDRDYDCHYLLHWERTLFLEDNAVASRRNGVALPVSLPVNMTTERMYDMALDNG